MSSYWLDEQDVTDQLYIHVYDGFVEFSLVRSEWCSGCEIARVDCLDQLLGDECMHMLCDHEMQGFLGRQWNGKWESVPTGLYIIQPGLFGFQFDERIFDPNCASAVLPDCGMSLSLPDEQLFRPTLASFPRLWELFGFLLPKSTRERVFEPAYNDLLAQHAKAFEPRFNTPGQICWLNFCFFVRSVCLLCECYRCLFLGSVAAAMMRCLPAELRAFVSSAIDSFFK